MNAFAADTVPSKLPAEVLASPAAAVAEASELPAAACEGYIDFIATRRTFGWAWCRDHPDVAVEVEIRIDDRPVVVTCADKFRPDLARVGVGDGKHGFDVNLPEHVGPDEKHRVTAFIVTAPGRVSAPLINRTVAVTVPRPPAVTADEQPADTSEAERPLMCSALVRDALSRIIVGQKACEASLSALDAEVRQITANRRGVDTRADQALTRVIEQLHGVQEALSRQSAATELLQARLDSIVALLGDREAAPSPQRSSGDRGLYWSVGVLSLISLSSLIFGIYSLLG
ncbi:MAG: hypothetical protein MUE49_00085 [Rhodospirillales bacterium]|jgi:hypothetical protein|nr:hypothetical protein [Rhodospirillales bacterium]